MRQTAVPSLERFRDYLKDMNTLPEGASRGEDGRITITDGKALEAVHKHITDKFAGLPDDQRYLVGLLAAAAQSEGHQPSREELDTVLGERSGNGGLEAMIAAARNAGFRIGTQGEQGLLALHRLEADMIYAGLPENNPSQQPDRYRLHGALAMAIFRHQVKDNIPVTPEVTVALADHWEFTALQTLWYLGDGKPRSASKTPESRGAVKLTLDYLNEAWKFAFREGSRPSLELMKEYGERALRLIELAKENITGIDHGLAMYEGIFLNTIALACYNLFDSKEAVPFAQKALQKAIAGYAHWESEGKRGLEPAVAVKGSLAYLDIQADALALQTYVLARLGDERGAKKHENEAITVLEGMRTIAEAISDDSEHLSYVGRGGLLERRRAAMLTNLGLIAYHHGETAVARDRLRLALSSFGVSYDGARLLADNTNTPFEPDKVAGAALRPLSQTLMWLIDALLDGEDGEKNAAGARQLIGVSRQLHQRVGAGAPYQQRADVQEARVCIAEGNYAKALELAQGVAGSGGEIQPPYHDPLLAFDAAAVLVEARYMRGIKDGAQPDLSPMNNAADGVRLALGHLPGRVAQSYARLCTIVATKNVNLVKLAFEGGFSS